MPIRRARPLLGTFVEIRVDGVDGAHAVVAIDAAFAEIATVHRLMSFHAHDSDVTRVNRGASRDAVVVDARTREVLSLSIDFARASDGRFDPTIAAELVARNLLPRPSEAPSPHPKADWRDIEIIADGRIRCAKPLWIDFGGIAKGYAVDRAVAILVAAGATQGCVNAGGDLRIFGARAERVHLRTASGYWPALELADAAVASSSGSAHIHGRTRTAADARASVGVVAATCMIADALTKVVLVAGAAASSAVLARFGAQACAHDSAAGWRVAA